MSLPNMPADGLAPTDASPSAGMLVSSLDVVYIQVPEKMAKYMTSVKTQWQHTEDLVNLNSVP